MVTGNVLLTVPLASTSLTVSRGLYGFTVQQNNYKGRSTLLLFSLRYGSRPIEEMVVELPARTVPVAAV